MRKPGLTARAAIFALLSCICALGSGSAAAQGLSGAAVDVTVVTAEGAPVPGATITMIARSTGAIRAGAADRAGTLSFDNVAVGSYRVTARVMGRRPSGIDSIGVHLGERLRIRLVMDAATPQDLGTVTVTTSSLRDGGAGGSATHVSRAALRGIPLLNRDFLGLLGVSSQAVGPGSLWVSGQHSRFNGIQIDGATANDIFGVNIAAGSGSGGRAIPLEALDEISILVAPFDVRQGGFSGGLINAVTRSGSNVFRGSAYSSYSRSELVGVDTAGSSVPAFDQIQYGMSAAGPIFRDRLHYFAVAETQSRSTRFSGFPTDEPQTGVSEATAVRAAQAFRERYGFDPGGPEPPRLNQPNANLFLKLSWQPAPNHTLEITQSLSRARNDVLNRELRNQTNVEGWQLSNSGALQRSDVIAARVRSLSTFGRFTNEALVSVSANVIRSDSRNRVPLFLVGADIPGVFLAGGSTKASQGTRTKQRVVEFTDNLTWYAGTHRITAGTQNIFLGVRDNFFLGSWGVWTFGSVESLERGEPSRYEVALPGANGGPVADYSSALLSLYAQDYWQAHPRLSLTAGLRLDVPALDAPRSNQTLEDNASLGSIRTSDFPSNNAILAPRIGFAWNVGRELRTMVRGGAGVFAGRPPFVWLTGAYTATGQEQSLLVCGPADGVPAPTTDIGNLPSRCLNTAARQGLPTVNYFDPGYRFQQAVKYVAGVDHDFGHSFIGSLDVIHTRSRDNTFVRDVNVVERGRNAEGRMMYGTFDSRGAARTTRVDSTGFAGIYEYSNVSGDRSTSVAVSGQRRWKSGGIVQAGYNWSRTLDVMSMTGLISSVILRSNPVDGTHSRRALRRSARDVPHNFSAMAVVPAGKGTTVSAFVRARSGTPYAFTVSGDANADGVQRNDLAYIPLDPADISLVDPAKWPALDNFIESRPCLDGQRGRIVTRNSCRNPAVFAFDGRIATKLWTRRERGLEISADLFNIPNMISSRWGLVRETSSREDVPLLLVSGWDAAKNRPRYVVPESPTGALGFPPIDQVVVDASRWRIQLGARYDF
ncbi:MAG: TonB-dependent receptor [Gemmatimonadaceae bacterium]